MKQTIALLKDYSSKAAEECCDGVIKVLSLDTSAAMQAWHRVGFGLLDRRSER
jgi:hypothetical protein